MRAIRMLAAAVLSIAVSLDLLSCGGGGGNSVQAPSGLSYPSPTVVNAGTPVSGITPTVMGSGISYAVTPALPAGLSLDPASGAITGTPSQGTPEAVYTITAMNSAGAATFPLDLSVAVGPVFEIKDDGTTALPVLKLSNIAPASGDMLTVGINVAGATSIALAVTGSGCGALAAQTVNGSSLQQTAAVADTGKCVLKVDVTAAGGTVSQTNEFTVVPTKLPAISSGLSFKGGSYFPSGDPSFLAQSSTLTIQSANAPQNFINGGTGSVFITPNDATGVTKALVTVSGIPGYFVAPVTPDNGRLRIDLSISPDFFKRMQQSGAGQQIRMAPRASQVGPPPGVITVPKNGIGNRDAVTHATATTTVTLMLELMDAGGGVSPPFSLPLNFQQVGSGPIQISLSWDMPVDLDLHAVTANGEEIYYGNRSDSTGGTLDTDSNAGCAIDNRDNENIVWPDTTMPAAGQYIVRVDYFASCGVTSAVPYTIRVTNCGTTSTFSGSFSGPGDADGGAAGAGATVATFMYTPCSGLSVQGKATYEDFVPTVDGLSTDPRLLPIRNAVLEVHKFSDDSLLEIGTTDESGNYSITFTMATPGMYYTEVQSAQNNETLREKVVNNMGALYAVKSDTQDASMHPNATNVDIKVTRDKFSGAFNIYNVGLNAFNFARAQTQVLLPFLTWQWTPGVTACGGRASCYHKANDTIYVQNRANDTDEFDDSVLAHEFGHFFIQNMSKDNSPGGPHSSDSRVAPSLAWSEGAATFFGQSVVNSPVYIDTKGIGAFVRDIETPDPDLVPAGTSDGTMTGNLSENYVSAVLWDLADSAQDTRNIGNNVVVKDVIANPQGVFSSLVSLKTRTQDRAISGVDLVDFLDQWLCSNFSTWDATPGNNFNGLVTGLNQFPYTPGGPQPTNCA